MPRAKKSDQLLRKLSRSMERPSASPAEEPPRESKPVAAAAAAPAAAAPAPAPAAAVPAPADPSPSVTVSASPARAAAAEEIVRRHLPYALGAGLLPLPLVDVAAISGVQLKLIAELSTLYGVEFTPHRARNLVVALLGGVSAWTLAAGVFGSAIKVLPGVGTYFGSSTLPLMAGAITYATGRVFIHHFESGGSLLDFNPAALRTAFDAKLAEGKTILRSR